MCAPAPFQSPRTGFGSSVAYDPEVLGDPEEQPAGHPQLVADQRRRRGRRPGTPTGPSSPRRWCPRSPDPASMQATVWRSTISRRASCRRRRRSSTGPGAPGSPATGQPSGRPSLKKVYSCSMPNTARGRRTSRRPRGTRRGCCVGCGREVGEQHLAHDELVARPAERVRADEDRLEHAVGVVPGRLVGARAVEAPDAGLLAVRDDLGLAADQRRRLGAVDPDVLRLVAHSRSCLDVVSRLVGRHPTVSQPRGRPRHRRPPRAASSRGVHLRATTVKRLPSTLGTPARGLLGRGTGTQPRHGTTTMGGFPGDPEDSGRRAPHGAGRARRDRRRALLGPARHDPAFLRAAPRAHRGQSSRRGSGSTGPRSGASRRSTSRT